MNYERLFSFTVFADHENFTHAARALHLSQPALHVQVRKLTEEVGVPLYVRRGRRLELTAAGRTLAAHGRAMQAQTDAVVASLRGETHAAPVVLQSGRGLFLYLLGDVVRRFPKKRWRLVLSPASADESLDVVLDGRADVAVTLSARRVAKLRTAVLRRVGQVVIMPRTHRLASRKRLSLTDLDGEELIVAPPGMPHREALMAAAREAGIVWEIAVEASGWELMLRFAASGLGIAVVNDFCPVPRQMVAIPLRGVPTVDLILARRERCTHPGAARLEELVRAALAE